MSGPLLELPAAALLDRFAGGRPTPGAGSAAALAGALAADLLDAVCRRILRPAGPPGAVPAARAAEIQVACRAAGGRLRAAVDGDAAAFERFWRQRREAGAAEALRAATELPLAIAADCAAVAALGRELFEHGPAGARGEAAAAVLTAVAGGETAAYAAALNLRSLPAGAPWAADGQREVARLRPLLAGLRGAVEDGIAGAGMATA